MWSTRPNPKVVGWARRNLFTFDYKKELLEHLITGHRKVYSLCTDTQRLEKKNLAALRLIEDKIRADVRTWAGDNGLKQGNTREFPSYDEESIVSRIVKCLRREDPADLGDFIVVPTKYRRNTLNPDGTFNTTSTNKEFQGYTIGHLGNQEYRYSFSESQKTADDLVSFLNNLKNDSELCCSMQDCIDTTKTIQSDDLRFDQDLEDFVHGKELNGVVLGGFCHSCPEFHHEKDKPQTKELFSQVDAFLREK
jgi:hypothetical protein